MNVQWNVRFAGRHATRLLLRSGTCWWKPRDVGLDHVHRKRQIISVAAMNSHLFCNHWSPILQYHAHGYVTIIIVATDTGDSDP
jgi:hypothetical protein